MTSATSSAAPADGNRTLATTCGLAGVITAAAGFGALTMDLSVPRALIAGAAFSVLLGALLAREASVRLVLLVLVLTGNLVEISGAPPGTFAALAAFVFLRDVREFRSIPRADAGLLLVVISLLFAASPSGYTLGVVGGLLLYVYASLVCDHSGFAPLYLGAAVGATFFGAYNFLTQETTYYTRVGRDPVGVSRRLAENLDPNSSAAFLLLGLTGALALAVLRPGLQRAMWLLAGAALLFFVVATAARLATIVAFLLVLYFLVVVRSRAWILALAGAVALIGAGYAYDFLQTNNLLVRFENLGGDTDYRTSLYRAWLDAWLGTPWSFLFGEPFMGDVPEVAPHNTLLELLSRYGLLLGSAAIMLTWRLRPNGTPPLIAVAGGWTVLAVAGAIGLLTLYSPWLALVLVLCRRTRPRASDTSRLRNGGEISGVGRFCPPC